MGLHSLKGLVGSPFLFAVNGKSILFDSVSFYIKGSFSFLRKMVDLEV